MNRTEACYLAGYFFMACFPMRYIAESIGLRGWRAGLLGSLLGLLWPLAWGGAVAFLVLEIIKPMSLDE